MNQWKLGARLKTASWPLSWCAVAGLALLATVQAGEKASKPAPPKPKADSTVTVDGQTYLLPGEPAAADANRLLLKKFDLNGDGRIDESEIAAAQKKLATNAVPAAPRAEDGRHITVKDLYDGGRASARKKNTTGDDDILKSIDRNGDGIIDAAEIEAFKRELDKQAGRNRRPLEGDFTPPFQPVKGDLAKPLPPPQKKPIR